MGGAVSPASLDHEASTPADLTPEEQAFVDDALALRAKIRIGDAGHPPDVTDEVLRRLRVPGRTHRNQLVLAAAAAFVLAALVGALAVRPGGPAAPRPAAAGIAERVIDGQRSIDTFDATVTVVERGAHPDVALPQIATPTSERNGIVTIDTTVARIDRLIDGLTSAGAIRSVHATDHVQLELDAESLTLRQLTVTAADNLARSTWGATNGYPDPPGTTILRITLDPTDGPVEAPTGPIDDPGDDVVSAGSPTNPSTRHGPLPMDSASTAPECSTTAGHEPRCTRTATGEHGSASTPAISGTIRDSLDCLAPSSESLPVGDGTGYTDPTGSAISLHRENRDVVVTGSVDLDTLAAAAAQTITGGPIDTQWAQAARLTQLPSGALAPPSDHIAVANHDDIVIAVGGPGTTGLVLTQSLATALPPPPKGDVVESVARGVPALSSPTLGTLTWLEDGWRRELRAVGLSLVDLQTAADERIEQ